MIIPNEQDAPKLAQRFWPFTDSITPGYMTPMGGGAFTFGGWTSTQMFIMGGVLVVIVLLIAAACAAGGSDKKKSTDEEGGDDKEDEETKCGE